MTLRFDNCRTSLNEYNAMVGETNVHRLRQKRQEVMLYAYFWESWIQLKRPDRWIASLIKDGHDSEHNLDSDLVYYIKTPAGKKKAERCDVEDLMTPEAFAIYLKRHRGR